MQQLSQVEPHIDCNDVQLTLLSCQKEHGIPLHISSHAVGGGGDGGGYGLAQIEAYLLISGKLIFSTNFHSSSVIGGGGGAAPE